MISARCLLFTPANKPDRFEEAKDLGADGLIIDLEDAISLDQKDEARSIVINALKARNSSSQDPFFMLFALIPLKRALA